MAGSDLFSGTVELLILRTLRDGPLHGYAIGRVLRKVSAGVLDVAEGVLYPALHRLEERGLLKAHRGPSETGRWARFYELTDLGRERLMEQREQWKRLSHAVDTVMRMQAREGEA